MTSSFGFKFKSRAVPISTPSLRGQVRSRGYGVGRPYSLTYVLRPMRTPCLLAHFSRLLLRARPPSLVPTSRSTRRRSLEIRLPSLFGTHPHPPVTVPFGWELGLLCEGPRVGVEYLNMPVPVTLRLWTSFPEQGPCSVSLPVAILWSGRGRPSPTQDDTRRRTYHRGDLRKLKVKRRHGPWITVSSRSGPGSLTGSNLSSDPCRTVYHPRVGSAHRKREGRD